MMRVARPRPRLGGLAARCWSRAASSCVAFDVDGVLVLGGKTVPAAPRALRMLSENDIPFVFMTNGGGHVEAQRAAQFRSDERRPWFSLPRLLSTPRFPCPPPPPVARRRPK